MPIKKMLHKYLLPLRRSCSTSLLVDYLDHGIFHIHTIKDYQMTPCYRRPYPAFIILRILLKAINSL